MNSHTGDTVSAAATHTSRENMRVLLVLLATAGGLGAGAMASADAAVRSNNPADWYEGTYVVPDESTIPNDARGDMIRYGRELLTETNRLLGPQSDMPYAGSKHSCSNCHMDNGTAAYGAPWVTVIHKYGGKGKYSGRGDLYRDVEARINGCMERSMNGRPLPRDSKEMKAMKAYFEWLATGIQVEYWKDVKGAGNIEVPDLERAADPVQGRTVYMDNCAVCHGYSGEGVYDEQAQIYTFPPLWGPDAYNLGAGMGRLRTAVTFIKGNMPYGLTNALDQEQQLSLEDAWDVTAYILSQTRPTYVNHLSDWSGYNRETCMPNWITKRVDAGYHWTYPRIKPDGTLTGDTVYPPKYPFERHKYGPYKALLEEQKMLKEAYLAQSPRPVYPNCEPFEYKPPQQAGK